MATRASLPHIALTAVRTRLSIGLRAGEMLRAETLRAEEMALEGILLEGNGSLLHKNLLPRRRANATFQQTKHKTRATLKTQTRVAEEEVDIKTTLLLNSVGNASTTDSVIT